MVVLSYFCEEVKLQNIVLALPSQHNYCLKTNSVPCQPSPHTGSALHSQCLTPVLPSPSTAIVLTQHSHCTTQPLSRTTICLPSQHPGQPTSSHSSSSQPVCTFHLMQALEQGNWWNLNSVSDLLESLLIRQSRTFRPPGPLWIVSSSSLEVYLAA